MGFLKASAPVVVADVAVEPDDIDFMEEEEADEVIDERPPGFDGPRTWEEVEENESHRVSLSISTHAVPSNDSGEAAARLAWQAAVLESDNQDPLGLGRIDAHGLRLVRQDRTLGRPGGTKRAEVFLTKRGNLNRQGTKDAEEAVKAAVSKPFLDFSGNLSDYRNQVMPTQDSFVPVMYLAIMHGDTTLSDLKTGRANLNFEVSERTGQLKDLVKENFERFISCKSTIDDIHVRLRKAEGDYGDSADGASTTDMVAAVTDVQQEAKHAVASMLERAGMSDRIKSVMGLLRRYESLFSLPTRIMQETERGEFETVISEYRKARGIMADVADENATEGVWHNLFLEVDKGVDTMTAKLTNSLRAPHVTVRQAADAIKHLLHLHAEGARSVQHLDPIKLYLEAQTTQVKRLFAAAAEEHAIALKSFKQQAAEQEASDVQWQQLQVHEGNALDLDVLAGHQRQTAAQARSQPASTSAATVADSTTSAAEEALWLQLLAKMTGHVVTHLPKIWQLTQEHLAPLGSISKQAQSMISSAEPVAASLLKHVLDDFRARATAILGQLSQAGTKADSFLAAVRLVAHGCQRAFEASGLPSLLPALTKILQEAGRLCISSLRASCSAVTSAEALTEECQAWPLQASASGGAHSSTPTTLAGVLQKGMEQLKAVHTEAEQAGITSLERPLSALISLFGCNKLVKHLRSSTPNFRVLSHQCKLLQPGDHSTATITNSSSVTPCDVLSDGHAAFSQNDTGNCLLSESLSGELRAAFHDCLLAFANSARQASGLVPQQASEEDEGENEQAQPEVQAPPVADAQLLLLHSNCVYVRTTVMAHLIARYQYWLAADTQQEQLEALQGQCEEELLQVEEQIMTSYINSKTGQLDQVLQSFFQDDMAAWPQAPPPTQLRDACLEVLFSLVNVRAEVHLLPPAQRQEVLQSLLQHMLDCFSQTLPSQLSDISTGGLLQLLLELQYLHAALAAYISSRLEEKFVQLGAALTEHIQDMQEQQQQVQTKQLDVWLSQAEGSDMMECMQARLAQVLSLATAGQQHNLRALRT